MNIYINTIISCLTEGYVVIGLLRKRALIYLCCGTPCTTRPFPRNLSACVRMKVAWMRHGVIAVLSDASSLS